MKKLTAILSFVFALSSLSAWAQENREFPKAEVFGGFSLLSLGGADERVNVAGFQASVAGNFHKNLGIVGDFGGHFKSGQRMWEYLFGPQVSLRQSRTTVFAHALFGGANPEGSPNHYFAMGIGGGLDVNLGDHFGVRLVQFDWIPIRFDKDNTGQWYKDQVRFGFGIVIK